MSKETRAPLRYPGSKYRAYKFIKPFLDAVEYTEYREPFLGSGGVFFRREKTHKTWLNDSDLELMNFYKVIQNEEMARRMALEVVNVKPTKEYFEEIKAKCPSDNYERAKRYFIINRTAYSGIMNLPNWGFHPVKSVQPEKWGERILESYEKLKHVELTCGDYYDLLFSESTNKVLLFIDPPYFDADQKRAYVDSFTYEDHVKLCELLKKVKYPFILTYDDCEGVKELYSWAYVHEIEFRYNTANASVTKRKMGKELIITNFVVAGYTKK